MSETDVNDFYTVELECDSKKLSELKRMLGKIERQRLGLRFNYDIWEIYDTRGVLASDRNIYGALKRL